MCACLVLLCVPGMLHAKKEQVRRRTTKKKNIIIVLPVLPVMLCRFVLCFETKKQAFTTLSYMLLFDSLLLASNHCCCCCCFGNKQFVFCVFSFEKTSNKYACLVAIVLFILRGLLAFGLLHKSFYNFMPLHFSDCVLSNLNGFLWCSCC